MVTGPTRESSAFTLHSTVGRRVWRRTTSVPTPRAPRTSGPTFPTGMSTVTATITTGLATTAAKTSVSNLSTGTVGTKSKTISFETPDTPSSLPVAAATPFYLTTPTTIGNQYQAHPPRPRLTLLARTKPPTMALIHT